MDSLKPLEVPKVEPLLHARIERFLSQSSRVFELVHAFGSPLNLIFPDHIAENVARFQDTFDYQQIQGRIFLSSKPNKSLAVLKRTALEDVSVDVSSEEALKRALGAGIAPNRLEATGPKNLDYLTLAILLGVLINVDSFSELERISVLARELHKKPVSVLVRLCGFTSPRISFTPHDSTFGINISRLSEVISYLVSNQEHISFVGFSYHLSSATEEEKVVALENTLQATFQALSQRLHPIAVDIGGSFRINYVKHAEQWDQFNQALKASVLGQRPSLSWNDSGLGYRNEKGVIQGAPAFMEHSVSVASDDQLCQLLSRGLSSFEGLSAARVLSENFLSLYIEPGRSLLDQVGITIAEVQFVKESAWGHTLVGLDMNRSNMHATQQKLMTDPIILPKDSNRKPAPNGVFYVGNLCVSYDLIQYQKTFPPFLPEPGDLVIFVNTAAYIMDFVESQTLLQRLAEKVAVVEREGKFSWCCDQRYLPVSLSRE